MTQRISHTLKKCRKLCVDGYVMYRDLYVEDVLKTKDFISISISQHQHQSASASAFSLVSKADLISGFRSKNAISQRKINFAEGALRNGGISQTLVAFRRACSAKLIDLLRNRVLTPVHRSDM
ncbi:hypothetical protein LXL04_024094 [Taraxacum kok-saghyz]